MRQVEPTSQRLRPARRLARAANAANEPTSAAVPKLLDPGIDAAQLCACGLSFLQTTERFREARIRFRARPLDALLPVV